MATVKNKETAKASDLKKYFDNPLADSCEYCGISYDDFETGENYQSIYDTLWKSSDDPSQWLNKGRHTVLGRWHELKQDMWRDHLDQCEQAQEGGEDAELIDDDFEIDEY